MIDSRTHSLRKRRYPQVEKPYRTESQAASLAHGEARILISPKSGGVPPRQEDQKSCYRLPDQFDGDMSRDHNDPRIRLRSPLPGLK